MDFFTGPKSYILFIPGVFIDDCKDSDDEMELLNLKNIKSESLNDIGNDSTDEKESISDDANLEQLEVLNIYEENYDNLDNIKIKNYESPPKYYINSKTWIKSSNLLCSYCRNDIKNVPYPLPLNQLKILIPEYTNIPEYIISPNKKEHADDNLLFSSQSNKEVKAFQIHNILFCDVVCAGNYIRKVDDFKVTNKKESIKMLLAIYKDLTARDLEDIPDKDLWIVMTQYCGKSGKSTDEYIELNSEKDLKFKSAIKTISDNL